MAVCGISKHGGVKAGMYYKRVRQKLDPGQVQPVTDLCLLCILHLAYAGMTGPERYRRDISGSIA